MTKALTSADEIIVADQSDSLYDDKPLQKTPIFSSLEDVRLLYP